jgi:hypothetical protein
MNLATAAERDLPAWQGIKTPRAEILFLPVQQPIGLTHQGTVGQLRDVVRALDQHAAAAAGRVVHAVTRVRVNQFDHQLHHGFGRMELTALFASIIGELFNQVTAT